MTSQTPLRRPLAFALGSAVVLTGTAGGVQAAGRFEAAELAGGYQLAMAGDAAKTPGEHQCGEGKCGAAMSSDSKPAAADDAKTKQAAENKCGEGKCGSDAPKKTP